VKEDADVVARLGTPVKGYGQDHGGNREGRRNFIQSADVPGAVEGESNLRIKFNLEGPYNKAQCFAEVQKNMDQGSVRSAARVCARAPCLTRPPRPPRPPRVPRHLPPWLVAGEWVYVIVQVIKTGEVMTLVDNRNALAAGGGSLKNNALANLTN